MPQGGGKAIYKRLSYQIIGVFYYVYNKIGYGYQEKVYERAIAHRFDELAIGYDRQVSYKVIFHGKFTGRYYIDFIVNKKIVLEIKRGDYFSKKHIDQIKAYLMVTNLNLLF
jgi:GxxExxY protein